MNLYQHGERIVIEGVTFYLNKNSTAAVTVTPPSGTSTGNDKMQIDLSAIVYIEE